MSLDVGALEVEQRLAVVGNPSAVSDDETLADSAPWRLLDDITWGAAWVTDVVCRVAVERYLELNVDPLIIGGIDHELARPLALPETK